MRVAAAVLCALILVAALAYGGCSEHVADPSSQCVGLEFRGGEHATLACSESIQWSRNSYPEKAPDGGHSQQTGQPTTRVSLYFYGGGDSSSSAEIVVRGYAEAGRWYSLGDAADTVSVRISLPNGIWFGRSPYTYDGQRQPAEDLEAKVTGRIFFHEFPKEKDLPSLFRDPWDSDSLAGGYFYFQDEMVRGRLELRLTPLNPSVPEEDVLITF